MVSPDQQRAAADYLDERYGVSQRRICRVMGRSRSGLRYRRKRRADEPALNREIKRLARRHPRYGYRRSMPCWSGADGQPRNSDTNGTRLAATSIRKRSWDGTMESINYIYTYDFIIVFAKTP